MKPSTTSTKLTLKKSTVVALDNVSTQNGSKRDTFISIPTLTTIIDW